MIITWQHLLLCFLTTASMELIAVTTQPIMLRLDADQIVDSVKSLLESQLLRQMTENKANEPTKTFAHDIGKDDTDDKVIIKQELEQILKEDSLEVKATERPVVVTTEAKSSQRKKPVKRVKRKRKRKRKRKKKVILNEELALALLREPSPDGDNLGLDSLEQPVTEPTVPKKINGIYMRKHIKPNERAVVTKSSLESDSNEG